MVDPLTVAPARIAPLAAGKLAAGESPLIPRLPASDFVASGLFLRHADQPRWLLLRATKHGEWGFPKGHVDPGETLVQTALRECAEECGIALVEILGPPVCTTYQMAGRITKTTVYYPAMTATSAVELSAEHDRAQWCAADEVGSRLVHPGLVALFRQALRDWPC